MVGALLTLPGASYLAGLDQIHKLKYSTTATVLLVVGFNLVMLWLLEVPLAGFVVAPDGPLARSIEPRPGSADTATCSRCADSPRSARS